MELLNEDNGLLLIKSSKEENALMRAVLRASLDFDPGMWGRLKEQNIHDLIAALEDYETVLKAHQLQVNLDVTMVGREADVQRLFDKFADVYGVEEETRKALRPPSLARDIQDYIQNAEAPPKNNYERAFNVDSPALRPQMMF